MATRSEGEGRAEPLIELSFFGTEEARLRGQPVGLSGPNLHAVAVLAVHAEAGVPTDELMGLLWSSGSAEDLRARLRQVRYTVRRTFSLASGLIRYEGARHFLDRKLIWSDLDRFEELLQRKAVLQAVELLCLGFLPSARSEGTRPLEAWVAEQERDMRARTRVAAARLWSEATGRADWDVAAEAARASLLLDPMEEANLRRLMEALAFTDRLEEASAEFRSFQERAETDGQRWEPEASTLQLRARLPDLVRRRLDSVLFRRIEGLTDPPLVGRDPELTRIGSALLHPPEDAVQVISISGETGIGKTRLAEEAIARALLRGSRILTAQCTELEQDLCLAPLISAISEEWIVEEIYGLPAFWRDILLRLAPELRRPHADPHDTSSLAPSQVRRLAVEAFCRLFTRMAASTHVILFVDDVHWADESTLLVLEHLKSRWRSGSLSVVVTEGEGELAPPQATKRPGVLHVVVPLDRLTAEAQDLLLEASPASHLSPGQRSRLTALAEGNPLFLLLLIQNAVSEPNDNHPDSVSLLPYSLVLMVRCGMQALSPTAREVMEHLACALEPVDLNVLAAATSISHHAMTSALHELQDRGWVTWKDGQATFARQLVHWAVLEIISPERRSSVTQRLLSSIERTDPHWRANGDEPRRPSLVRLAHYHLISNNLDLSRKTALAAVDDTELEPERRELIGILEEIYQRSLTPDDDLAAVLGRLYFESGDPARASSYYGEAERRYRLRGADQEATRLTLDRLRARLRLQEVDLQEVAETCDDLLTLCKERQWYRLLAEAIHLRIRIADAAFDVSTATRLIAEAQELTEVCAGDPETHIELKATEALATLFAHPENGLAAAREATLLAEREENSQLTLRTYNLLFLALLHLGLLSTQEGNHVIRKVHALTLESRDVLHRTYLKANRAVWLIDTWRYDEAIMALRDALDEAGPNAPAPAKAPLYLNLATAHYRLRNMDEAHRNLSHGLDLLSPGSSSSAKATAIGLRGLLAIEAGSIARAKLAEEELIALPRPWRFDPTVPLELRSLILWHTGKEGQVFDLLRSGIQEFENRMPLQRISLWNLLAEFHRRGEQPSKAREAWEKALAAAKVLQVDSMVRTVQRKLRLLA